MPTSNLQAWRNGRRTSLRGWREQSRMGSSPIACTNWEDVRHRDVGSRVRSLNPTIGVVLGTS